MDAAPDLDEVVARLRARVEQRRRAGEYPPDLEEALAAHLRRIAVHRATPDHRRLRQSLRDLEAVSFHRDDIPLGSEVPGGAALHRAVARLVGRQTQGVLEQVQRLADAVRAAVSAVIEALEDPRGHVHADLVDQLDAVLERLAAFDGAAPGTSAPAPTGGGAALEDLRRRTERLEAAERSRHATPWYPPERFEAAFRGSRDDLRARYRDLAERLRAAGPVLDVGCGRGEFLELLAEQGTEARGVELDSELAAAAQRRGLEVVVDDGVAHLRSLQDASLGAVCLLQVIEHLPPQGVLDVVAVAAEKLRPGGLLLVETPNCQSLYAMAHAFYIDPTHSRPVHPAFLQFLANEAGFRSSHLEWRSPPPAAAALIEKGDGGEGVNIERLNALLFAPQDYALVATR